MFYRKAPHSLRSHGGNVPPAILADEQAKITNFIFRENKPVFVP